MMCVFQYWMWFCYYFFVEITLFDKVKSRDYFGRICSMFYVPRMIEAIHEVQIKVRVTVQLSFFFIYKTGTGGHAYIMEDCQTNK